MNANDILYCIIYQLAIISRNRNKFHSMLKKKIRKKILKLYVLYIVQEDIEKRGKKRQFWVRPIFTEERRLMQGVSDNLARELEILDPEKFFNYFRMDFDTFEKLFNIVKPLITKHYIVRTPISARIRLQLTVRYLASGDSMVSLSYAFRIAHNTVSKIISETCEVIWSSLKDRVFLQPTASNWEKISDDFENICNFNHCIGAPDGKHVVIQAPPNSGSRYYNYKGQHSIILLAISDANCCFSIVDIGGEGRQCDSTVFRNSELGIQFRNNSLQLPAAKNIANSTVTLPYVLVADEAFQLTSYMMRPYQRSNLDMRKKVFNYRLSRARRTVECAFGLLAARWRIYKKPIVASVSTARKIIKATTILHNFVMISERNSNGMLTQYSQYTTQDRALMSEGLRDMARCEYSSTAEALKIRDNFTDFFNNIGAVPWQWRKVLNNDF